MRVNFLFKIMKKSWGLPSNVPSDVNRFLSGGSITTLRWLFKYLKRRLFCFVCVEFFGILAERQSILPAHRRILWINWAAPSLGDSLMDLSSRVLLKGRQVTLLTHPKNADLFINDEWFDGVYSSPRVLVSHFGRCYFDLVICDSFSPRVLIKKLFVTPFVDFCGLYGYLNGFEVHRTLFAYHRMASLIGITLNNVCLKPHITIESNTGASVGTDICIAVGGEWEFRTYNYWCEVALELEKAGLSIVLVGSANGMAISNLILERCQSVTSTVGLLDLKGVAQMISNCRLFVGADGGLWHIASSISVPSVVLFADCQLFDQDGIRVTRQTKDTICETLYDEWEVSNIPVEQVLQACKNMFKRIGL